jgi:hypothetical protein
MLTISQIKKTLVPLTIGELSVDPKYTFHSIQSDENTKGLELSIKEDGYQGVMTAVKKDDTFYLINGIRCHSILLDLHGPDFKVYVWVLDGQPTDEEIKIHILALGKVRKKSKVDLLAEHEVWDKVYPSNQGKKDVDKNRIDLIATRMGISPSLLNKLIRINKADPDLIRQLDVGDTDLKKAEARAKHEEKESEKKKLLNSTNPTELDLENLEQSTTKYKDVDVRLDDLPTCCPTCNRQFSTITPEEIPSIFNVDKKEGNQQITWMQKTA